MAIGIRFLLLLLLSACPRESLRLVAKKRRTNADPPETRAFEFIDPELVDRVECRNSGLFLNLIDHKAVIGMCDAKGFIMMPFF